MEAQDALSFCQYELWLESKAKDFYRQGYANVSSHDLWEYLTSYRWKKGTPSRYYEIVNDIMKITPNQYFNYESLKAQVYDVKTIDQYDLSNLL